MHKRLFDFFFSAVGLVLTSPILVIFLVLVWLQDFRSPLYIAPRVGRDGKVFRMVKMRSMVVNADKTGVASTKSDDKRITIIGRVIRKAKLDEITQLWNVFCGHMSLVGPRPQVEKDVALYTEDERRLLSVRPGITDFASIVFSDEGEILVGAPDPDLAYQQLIRPWKSRLGLFYIDNQSLSIDLRLIFLTIMNGVSRRYSLDRLTMLLSKLGADRTLQSVSQRRDQLEPYPPPGSSVIAGSG
jgi:lipopolysaccharide/colanic/teichoic acid biosynthesis glycosyltransferase